MTRTFRCALTVLLLPALTPAFAQSGPDALQDGYRPAGPEAYPMQEPLPELENVSHGYAQVLRADEVVEIRRVLVPQEQCEPEPEPPKRVNTGGAVIGAILGAALGNQVGDGDGRRAATAVGAVAGGVIGSNIARNRELDEAGRCEVVQVEQEQSVVVGYDVEYMYKGDKYLSRLPYDPGNRLRVRVSVTPDDAGDYPP
jgi:uncharacterized protein YcfJ